MRVNSVDDGLSANGHRFRIKIRYRRRGRVFFRFLVCHGTADVAQFARYVTWTTRVLFVLPAILGSPIAGADGGHAVSASASWAAFSARGKKVGTMQPPELSSPLGGSLAGIYEWSLSSDFSLRAEAAGAAFYAEGAASYVGFGDLGVTYRFDVLKYVPYAFAGLGGIVSTGGAIDRNATFVVALGGGLDVLVNRDRSWGVEARVASFASDVTVFTLGLRGTVRWGYL